jgi:hypothetical protein
MVKMKKLFSLTAAGLLVAGLTVSAADAKHRRHHHMHHASMHRKMTTGMGGNNAELMGNNGNSASGSNSLGHIKGGNVGAGE